jgi:putative transposase
MILQSYEAEASKLPVPKPPEIHLTDEERQGLEKLVNRHNAPRQVVLRARIVLAADDGKNNAQIAGDLEIGVIVARRWRNRCWPCSQFPWPT